MFVFAFSLFVLAFSSFVCMNQYFSLHKPKFYSNCKYRKSVSLHFIISLFHTSVFSFTSCMIFGLPYLGTSAACSTTQSLCGVSVFTWVRLQHAVLPSLCVVFQCLPGYVCSMQYYPVFVWCFSVYLGTSAACLSPTPTGGKKDQNTRVRLLYRHLTPFHFRKISC